MYRQNAGWVYQGGHTVTPPTDNNLEQGLVSALSFSQQLPNTLYLWSVNCCYLILVAVPAT